MSVDQYDVDVNRYSENEIREFMTTMFMDGMGTTEEECEVLSEGLLTACYWWHPGQGQGLEKFFRLTAQVANGGINVGAKIETLKEGAGFALLNANKAFGYVAAARAMDLACEKAKENGVAGVGVCQSNHFGIAGYHAYRAAKQGMIGISMTNALAEMAPWGAKDPVLGTNPWGIAVPRKNAEPVVLDMALTMSGVGMIRWFAREGREVPIDWALTPDGRQTTDPEELEGGTQLPIGKYKGYGLSLMTDIISGVMTGSLFGTDVFQDLANHDVGSFVIAINPEMFMDRDTFYDRLEVLLDQVKSAEPIEPGDEILLPGEMELRRKAERQKNGIPIDKNTVAKLREIAAELDVPCNL